MRSLPLLASFLLIAVACAGGDRSATSGGDSTATGGTIVISTGGDPDVLFPPLVATTQGRQVSELVYDHLADVGPNLNVVGDGGFVPRLAKSWSWSPDSLSIVFVLDSRARWHDGAPVRASDVVFTYALYKDSANGSPTAPLIADIDSVTARDTLTAVFWFGKRSPMQFFQSVNPMVVLPEHALRGTRGLALRTSPLARSPIGSGSFRFVSWKPGASIELAADTGNYHGHPRIERVIWSIAPDGNTAFTRLLGGESDVLEQISAPQLPQLAGRSNLRIVLLAGQDYNFIQFNLRDPANKALPHPLFANRALRRALTMAVDRAHTVRNVYDTLAEVAVGPTVRAYPTTDTTLKQIPYSVDGARRLLDSLGWRQSASDSIRRRNGRPLEFTVSVPNSSRNRLAMAVLVQDQLKQVGAKMNIDQLDFPSFVDREARRAFDAAFGSWHVDLSPAGIRQTWGSRGARAAGGINYGSYENPVVDEAADSALSAMNPDDRRRRFTRAYQLIIDDAPAIWLAEPRSVLAVSKRIRTPSLRPDAWWANIGSWWIPANEQIARDRAGAPR